MVTRWIALVSLALLGGVGCEESGQKTGEGGVGLDSALCDGCTESDGPAVTPDARSGDGAEPADLVSGDYQAPFADASGSDDCGALTTCWRDCAGACTGDEAARKSCVAECTSDCSARGCLTAQLFYDAWTICMAQKCAPDCELGPSPGCETCLGALCSDKETACDDQTC
jgi:hypothetical protein